MCACALPFVLQRLDVEAERRGDGADVFSVKLLEDGGLSRVVQTSARARLKRNSHLMMNYPVTLTSLRS